MHVRAAPGDVWVAADGEDRQRRRHQPHRVIGGRVHAGDQPKGGHEDAEMGIVGDQCAAGLAAIPRQGEAVTARLGDAAEQALHRGGLRAAVEAGERRLPFRDQTRPELGPVAPCAERERVGPDQPVRVGAGEAADGDHVRHCPGLGLEAEHGEVVRQFGGVSMTRKDVRIR